MASTALFGVLDFNGVAPYIVGGLKVRPFYVAVASFIVFALMLYWQLFRQFREIGELKDTRARLKLASRETHSEFHPTDNVNGNIKMSTLIKVTNCSQHVEAVGCRVIIRSFQSDFGWFRDNKHLTWYREHDNLADIEPGGHRYVVLFVQEPAEKDAAGAVQMDRLVMAALHDVVHVTIATWSRVSDSTTSEFAVSIGTFLQQPVINVTCLVKQGERGNAG